MSGRGVPVWLCSWPGRTSIYVKARDSERARQKCVAMGHPRPLANTRDRSWVKFAGYSTGSVYEVCPRRAGKKNAPKIAALGRRAELALTIYGILRLDWPIGSLLASAAAEARWQASSSALRDFVANVGAAMARVKADTKILEDVVRADALAWWWSGREKNFRLRGNTTGQEYAREKRERFRRRVRTLRKRVGYVTAVGELTAALNGTLEADEKAAAHMAEKLAEQGLNKNDADDLARRWCRVGIPRWS